jgi:hypothetical protein
MNYDNKLVEYKDCGYFILRNFFDKREISDLRREVKRIFGFQIWRVLLVDVDLNNDLEFEGLMYKLFEADLETFMNCGKQAQQLITLHRLGTDPRIVELLKAIGLGYPIISVRPSMLFNSRNLAKKEEYWKLGAHQDWRSSQGSLDSVTLWFPLVKTDANLGALQVIPRTHKLGLLQSESVSYYGKIVEDFKDNDYVQLEFEDGDALFFSSFLVHRSGINETDRVRWSVQLRYNNIEEPTFIERGFPHPFTYKPQAELLVPDFPRKDQVFQLFN